MEWPYSKWFNFMNSFSESESLRSIFLGVVTERAGLDDRDKFTINLELPCGFNILDKTEKDLAAFVEILEKYGAKGRRKFLRLDTQNSKDVSGYLTSNGKLYSINIKDLSSAGFAITYKQEIMNLFQKNTKVSNLCLSIGRKSIVCSCIVFNTQPNQDGTAMSVLMLTNENPGSTKNYIRSYVIDSYVKNMDAMLSSMDSDVRRYDLPDNYAKLRMN